MDHVIIAYLATCATPDQTALITRGMELSQDIGDSQVEIDVKNIISDVYDEEIPDRTAAILNYFLGLMVNRLMKMGIHVDSELVDNGHLTLLYDTWDYTNVFMETEDLDNVLEGLANGENNEDAYLNVMELFSHDVATDLHEILRFVSSDYIDNLKSQIADKKELINEPLPEATQLPADYSSRIQRVIDKYPNSMSIVAEAVKAGFDLYRDPVAVAKIFSNTLVTIDSDSDMAMELAFIIALSNTPEYDSVDMNEIRRAVFEAAAIDDSHWLEVNHYLRQALGRVE